MSENLDLVSRCTATTLNAASSSAPPSGRTPRSSASWWTGLRPTAGSAWPEWHECGKGFLAAYEDFSAYVEEYREIDARRILVLLQFSGRGRASGLEIGSMSIRNASVYDIEGGLVRRLALYWDRDRALADLGLAE
jgi:hypothetical protein